MTDPRPRVSPLRRRMIEDMTLRNLSPATQRSYLHAVAKFSRYFGRSPDCLDIEDVRAFQVQLVSRKISLRTRCGLGQAVRERTQHRRHVRRRRHVRPVQEPEGRFECRRQLFADDAAVRPPAHLAGRSPPASDSRVRPGHGADCRLLGSTRRPVTSPFTKSALDEGAIV